MTRGMLRVIWVLIISPRYSKPWATCFQKVIRKHQERYFLNPVFDKSLTRNIHIETLYNLRADWYVEIVRWQFPDYLDIGVACHSYIMLGQRYTLLVTS